MHQVRHLTLPLSLTACRGAVRRIRRAAHPATSPSGPRTHWVTPAAVAAESASPAAAVTSETAAEASRTEPERTDTYSTAFGSGPRGECGRGAALLEEG